jgi:hypothetical protein
MSRIKQKRNGYIFIWVMLVVSIFMFRYVREASRLEERELRDFSKMQYSNELAFVITDDDIKLGNLKDFFGEKSNLSAVDIPLFLDDVGYCYTSEIVIKSENYIYPIVTGEYPSQSRLASGEPCVVLGKKMYKFTYSMNGKRYIRICGDEYEVTGYISMPESSVLDHRIVLFDGCLAEGVEDDISYYINAMGIVCIVGYDFGDKTDIQNEINALCKVYENTALCDGYTRFAESEKIGQKYIIYAKELFLFSLLSLIMFGNLWMLQLRREIAIRRAFGYSLGRIIGGLMVKISIITFLSAMSAEIVIDIITVVSHEMLTLNREYVFDALSDYVFSWGIIVIVLIIPCAFSIIRNNPLKLLVEKNK